MKREIKFRAWDKVHQKYAEYDKGKKCIYTPFSGMENEFNNLNEDDFMFEQFTGLKDKNGVEIYEGDFVRGYFTFYDVVTFENGFFKWDGKPITIEYDEPDKVFNTGNWAEVIGNIHENGELLG